MTHGNGKRSALGLRYRTPSSLLRLVEAGEEARKKPSLRIAGLFAGVGGLELGFQRAGHEALMLCEIDEPAKAVLHAGSLTGRPSASIGPKGFVAWERPSTPYQP